MLMSSLNKDKIKLSLNKYYNRQICFLMSALKISRVFEKYLK